MPPITTRYYSVCLSVTLVHPVGQNEMPFCRDIHVVPNNIVLDRGLGPPREREIWGSKPQFAVMPPIAKLLVCDGSGFSIFRSVSVRFGGRSTVSASVLVLCVHTTR